MIRLSVLLAPVAFASALLTACSGAAPLDAPAAVGIAARDTALLSAESAASVGFTMATVAAQPWRDVWSVPARITLDAAATQTIGSIVEGRVSDVLVRPGDQVQPGQVLVMIHSHEMTDARGNFGKAQAAAAEASAAFDLATAEAARAERLFAARALSQAELERARTASLSAAAMQRSAEAELERAQAMVSHLVGGGPAPRSTDQHDVLIRSAISGTVVTRAAQPGTVVLVGAPLVTVSRVTTLTLLAQLPERAIGSASRGSTVRFTVAAYPARVFTARVSRIAPALDSLTRTLEVLATIDDPTGALKPEMYAMAELLGTERAPALSVPAAAVQAFEGDTVVIVATRHGAALALEAMPVRVGRRTAQMAELLSGVPAGAIVIAERASVAKAEILKRRSVEP